jgi:hypothetical protein
VYFIVHIASNTVLLAMLYRREGWLRYTLRIVNVLPLFFFVMRTPSNVMLRSREVFIYYVMLQALHVTLTLHVYTFPIFKINPTTLGLIGKVF